MVASAMDSPSCGMMMGMEGMALGIWKLAGEKWMTADAGNYDPPSTILHSRLSEPRFHDGSLT
jgi:hypothetical protein